MNLNILTFIEKSTCLESKTIRPISTNFNLPQDQIPIAEDMTNVLYHESTERFMKEVLMSNTEFSD